MNGLVPGPLWLSASSFKPGPAKAILRLRRTKSVKPVHADEQTLYIWYTLHRRRRSKAKVTGEVVYFVSAMLAKARYPLKNVAKGKLAKQQNTYDPFEASSAVDGNLETPSVANGALHIWWAVDLTRVLPVQRVVVTTASFPGSGRLSLCTARLFAGLSQAWDFQRRFLLVWVWVWIYGDSVGIPQLFPETQSFRQPCFMCSSTHTSLHLNM